MAIKRAKVKVIRLSDDNPKSKEIFKSELKTYMSKGYRLFDPSTKESTATVKKTETKKTEEKK